MLFRSALPGGETATAYQVSNYLGFPGGILGEELSLRMEQQLEEYQLYFTCEPVEDILNAAGKEKEVRTQLGRSYKTKAIILACGLEPKLLGADFEKKFTARGISYYAQGDANEYKGKDVAVIGGGNCACYAADYLSKFVNKLYLIHRSDDLKAVKRLKQKIFDNPVIDILWNTEPVEAFGLDRLEKIKLNNIVTHQTTWLDVKGVFVYVGRTPPEDILSFEVNVDENGFIVTDDYMRTNVKGIYAAGDIRSKQIRQIATAVSDGMIAGINVEKDLNR